MRLARNRWLAAAVVLVVAADWLSKFWVQNRLLLGSVRPVLRGWVWLVHRRNPGVAFSFLADLGSAWRTPLLVAGALAGLVVAGRILAAARDPWTRIAAALVIAGALGNLGDRIVNQGVTDFILVRWFPFVFNLADVAITVGALVLAARFLREGAPGGDSAAPTPTRS